MSRMVLKDTDTPAGEKFDSLGAILYSRFSVCLQSRESREARQFRSLFAEPQCAERSKFR